MRYRITHKTDYRYVNAVAQSNHLVHLGPRQTMGQTIERHELLINPKPALRRDYHDYFGNPAQHLVIEENHNLFSVEAQSIINVERDHTATLALSVAGWETVRDLMFDPKYTAEAEFTCYTGFTTPTAEIAAYGEISFPPGRPMLQAVLDLTSRIYHDFDYDSTITDATTPVEQMFEIKGGVCQDFAHLQLACLRALGLPARYVSGYLRTYPPEGQPRLVGADASHAWISVWCPEAGWVDFDPTNNKMIADEHITLTIGRDFVDVSPLSGVILGGGQHFIDVSVDVMPIDNSGKEIGQSITNADQQAKPAASAPAAPALAPSAPQSPPPEQATQEQSQAPGLARTQEQSQSQAQQSQPASGDQASQTASTPPIPPISADRTY
ncbi:MULTISPECIES: transglutaminase family protein [Cohaesibacter]|uniref:transglutaminase family protein n=1 Tax=Cohaesibacter TaxID=655352 RepID=UPI000DE92466|nr:MULTISPECIES: transglutaminase family protein [Cohaesibacter]TLP44310.1 transglutaminase family protein [Cohaesibacter sp. CAU 1516]